MHTSYYIVTGASKGIGFSLVEEALSNKQEVLAVSRNTKGLEGLAVKHRKLKVVSADLSREEGIEKVVFYLKRKEATVNTLVNNAGALVNKPFEKLTREDIQKMNAVNYEAPFFLTQKLLSFMEENSHVVNISSMGGFQGASKFPGLSGYSSSKGALSILTECLAEELKNEAIKVNCLCLGAVQTEMLAEAFPGFEAPTTPKQMAEYIFSFSRKARNYYNGKVLPVSLSTP